MATVDFKELINYTDYDTLLTEAVANFDSVGTGHTLKPTTAEYAMLVTTMYGLAVLYDNNLEFVQNEAYAQLASGDNLSLHAEETGIPRDAATFAQYEVTFTRTATDITSIEVPVGTLLRTATDALAGTYRYLVVDTGDSVERTLTNGGLGTGTVDTDGTVNVVGHGTLAGTQVRIGDAITVGAETLLVATITTAISFTVAAPGFTPTATGQVFTLKQNSKKILVKAESDGTGFNVGITLINTLVNPVTGIESVSNVLAGDQTVTAIDTQTDINLRKERIERWAGTARAGTIGRYKTLAKEVIGVNFVQVISNNPRGADTVDVYYTLSSGVPAETELTSGTSTGISTSKIVTGVGTAYTTDYKVGDRFSTSADTAGPLGTTVNIPINVAIKSIESDTSLTLKDYPLGTLQGRVSVLAGDSNVTAMDTGITSWDSYLISNNDFVTIKGLTLSVGSVEAEKIVLVNAWPGSTQSDLKAYINSCAFISTHSYNITPTASVYQLIWADDEHVLNADVDIMVPSAISVSFNVSFQYFDGGATDLEARVTEVINALFVPDEDKYPNVAPFEIGMDVEGDRIKKMIFSIGEVFTITLTEPTPLPVVMRAGQIAVKGTVTATTSTKITP